MHINQTWRPPMSQTLRVMLGRTWLLIDLRPIRLVTRMIKSTGFLHSKTFVTISWLFFVSVVSYSMPSLSLLCWRSGSTSRLCCDISLSYSTCLTRKTILRNEKVLAFNRIISNFQVFSCVHILVIFRPKTVSRPLKILQVFHPIRHAPYPNILDNFCLCGHCHRWPRNDLRFQVTKERQPSHKWHFSRTWT